MDELEGVLVEEVDRDGLACFFLNIITCSKIIQHLLLDCRKHIFRVFREGSNIHNNIRIGNSVEFLMLRK